MGVHPVVEVGCCFGDPEVGPYSCPEDATIGVTQLRPGYTVTESDSAEPVLVLIGVCRMHARVTRESLAQSWPHDPVDLWPLFALLDNLEGLEERMAPTPVLVSQPA